MLAFPSQKDLAAEVQRRLVIATSVAVESLLADPAWRRTVTHQSHAALIVRALFHIQPHLIGVLSEAHTHSDIDAAFTAAQSALSGLFASDPFLLQPSVVLKREALRWLVRHYPSRDTDELRGIADRAGGDEPWLIRYAAQHALAEREGIEAVEHIAASIKAGLSPATGNVV